MLDRICRHVPTGRAGRPCTMGCHAVAGLGPDDCYLERIDAACQAIRRAGEIGPGAAAVAYYEAMAATGAAREARAWIARLDLADSASDEDA